MFNPIYKYRIVKLGDPEGGYRVDVRFMFFFWMGVLGGVEGGNMYNYKECEAYIVEQIERNKPKPADTVVKQFRG